MRDIQWSIVRATARIAVFLLKDWIAEMVLALPNAGRLAQKPMNEDLAEATALLSELEELL